MASLLSRFLLTPRFDSWRIHVLGLIDDRLLLDVRDNGQNVRHGAIADLAVLPNERPPRAGSVGARSGSSTTTCRASAGRLRTLALLSEWDGAEVVQPPVFKLNDLQGP